ncbi:hypothetical protein M407DRAFT_29577 [Tulasnella calospora MUT 4182]|uniref:C2H2-type domain-containing protein n=1 Tax=Tulasnella calospora MUT 4182 TaxID=1051891 RepID=A0A0C3PZ95_9AGAM|nr:hypothetical protein M407DRAFT_29577 [Tulasnella calospora MUT 4182]
MSYDALGLGRRRCPKCNLNFTSEENLELHQKIHPSLPNSQHESPIVYYRPFSNSRCNYEEHERIRQRSANLARQYRRTEPSTDEHAEASSPFPAPQGGLYHRLLTPTSSTHERLVGEFSSTRRRSSFWPYSVPATGEAVGSSGESRRRRLGRCAPTLRTPGRPRPQLDIWTEREPFSRSFAPESPFFEEPLPARVPTTSELSESVFDEDILPSSDHSAPWNPGTSSLGFWMTDDSISQMDDPYHLTPPRRRTGLARFAALTASIASSNSQQDPSDTTSELSLEMSRSPSPMPLPDTSIRQETTPAHNATLIPTATPSSISQAQLSDTASDLSLETSRSPTPISLPHGT